MGISKRVLIKTAAAAVTATVGSLMAPANGQSSQQDQAAACAGARRLARRMVL